MSRVFKLLLTATLSLAITTGLNAQAQWWGQQTQTQPGKTPPPKRVNTYKMNPRAFDTTTLHTPPDLAYVPMWTGQKPRFVDGFFYQKQMPVENYTLTWQYKEPANIVMQWYRDNLPSQGWKVLEDQSRENVVNCRHTKENIDFTVQVSPGAVAGYACTVEMRYQKLPPLKHSRR